MGKLERSTRMEANLETLSYMEYVLYGIMEVTRLFCPGNGALVGT